VCRLPRRLGASNVEGGRPSGAGGVRPAGTAINPGADDRLVGSNHNSVVTETGRRQEAAVTSVLDHETLRCSPDPRDDMEVTPMYAVIRAYTGNPDLADTLAEHEEDIRQLIGGINGFKAYYLLRLAEGTSTVSVFDDQEGAEESSRAAAAWLAENLPDLNVAAPYVTAGEVLVGF